MKRWCVKNTVRNAVMCVCAVLLLRAYAHAQEYMQLSCAVHISSTISDGKYTLEELADIAQDNGFDVLIPTDRDSMAWEYGIAPARNIFKKRVEERSISTFGAHKYLQRLDSVRRSHPGLVVIPGIETAPFYYWQGSIFNNDLVIRDWHKHMLVIGLSDPDDLEYLPVIGNPKGLRYAVTAKNIILFWPLILMGAGVWMLRMCAAVSGAGAVVLSVMSRRSARITGIVLIVAAVILLADNYPFRFRMFDQYHGSAGSMPYQNVIDYARSRRGLTFWAHPESANTDRSGPVGIQTGEYSGDLLATQGYTGFAVFYDGYAKVGRVGGIWDRVLTEYCAGMRASPVWAIAGFAFDKNGELGALMRDLRTVVLSTARTGAAVLDSLDKGRMYCVRGAGSSAFSLDSFTVADVSGSTKTMGEEAKVTEHPQIRIKGHILRGQDKSFTIQLIRDGTIVQDFEAVSPFDISYADTLALAKGRSFYRVQIIAKDVTAVTNPIFVHR